MQPAHLQLALELAVGLGAACLGNVSNAALVGGCFRARLTLVKSGEVSAFGIGILVMVPVAQIAIDRFGRAGGISLDRRLHVGASHSIVSPPLA